MIVSIVRLAVTLFNQLILLLMDVFVTHVRTFYLTLDPIKTVGSFNEIPLIDPNAGKASLYGQIKENVQFLFPFVMMVITNLDSVLVLYQSGFHYNVTGLPTLLTHRIYPPELQLEGDVVCNVGIVMEMFVYGCLLLAPPMNPRYRMYALYDRREKGWKIVFNGKTWHSKNTNKILRYREKARKVLTYIMVCVFVQSYAYWTGSLLIKPTKSMKDYVILAFLPFFSLYSSFGVVYMPFYFVLCAHYMQIKQQLLVDKIKKFTYLVAREDKLAKAENVDPLVVEACWRKFVSINREILALFDELHAYNAFWSKYVTSYFTGYIAMAGYLSYGFLFAESDDFNWQKTSFFSFFTLETIAVMLTISYECSCIVYYNIQIYKTNRMFCYAFGKVARTRHVYLLKMSKMISNYRGTRNGFRLINNYIIDSKMFEILFFYISTLFIMVFRNKHSNFESSWH